MLKFPQIDLNGIKGVLLDLDNTLYCYDECHLKAINECHLHYQNNLDQNISFTDFSNAYRKNRDIVTKRLSPGGACRSRLFAFQTMFEDMQLDGNFELAQEYDEIYWASLISNMHIAKDAAIFLQNCKDSKIDICIVTDMTASIQIRKLQKLGISLNIKYLVTSEEVGAEKPDPIMFETAMKKLNLTPSEVIMIGDSESKDIKGAQALGIESYKVLVEGR